MTYFGTNSDPDCMFIGKRCAIPGVATGTIVDSTATVIKHHRLFAVKLDGSKYITQLFYSDIQIHRWDCYKREFNDDPENQVE